MNLSAINKLLSLLLLPLLMGCEATFPAEEVKLWINEKVFSSPVEMGFPALNTESENFNSGESWNEFIDALKVVDKDKSAVGLGDWQTLHDFNMEADALWKDLVRCNDSNVEVTRGNYFTGKLCSHENPEPLKQRLIQMHKNLENFLSSTLFMMPKAAKRNTPYGNGMFDKILYDLYANLYTKETDYDGNDPQVQAWKKLRSMKQPLLHPLFSQLVIEHMSVINRITGSPYQSLYRVGVGHDETLMDFKFHPMILVRMAELTYWKELADRNLLDDSPTYGSARALANSWFLYSIMAKESCEQLGLWPEMSVAALLVITGQNVELSREVARSVDDAKCGGKFALLKKEWAEAPQKLNDRDSVLVPRKLGIRYGYKPYDKVYCLTADFRTRGFAPKYKCFSMDPASPSDTEDGIDWARKKFNNPKAARAAQAYDFISKQ